VNIHDIETPAVLIDVDILDRNLHAMANYCKTHNLSLRPHTKTHKMPEIARLQIQYGAPGITVAKLGEAEVMADAGIVDIVVVYPLWGASKWKRLASLAKRIKIAVTMDSMAVAEGISDAAKEAGVEIGVRLEFDTGLHRCGLPIQPGSIDIAKKIRSLPNLLWEGISVYPGHIMSNRALREQEIPTESSQMDRLYALLDDAGISYPIVSGGNTPAAFESHRFHGVTEIRPGTYVFNDRNTVDAESASYAECAATVLTTVVSTSVEGRAIIDAGSKTLTADALLSGARKYYGFIPIHPELILDDLSEEHGHLKIEQRSAVKVGDRLRVVPNHICPCINLHDTAYIVSGEQVIDRWTIAGRGKVS
jgi:D-serine deaminase-like pyridoxal phosphate-dependent protein